ncbi:hypothetical protein IscW_ISCW002696 [Ixodes scapularis]|uniref:Uncharacterized protein n=1 Tax=Ixodes scapularis TaxID=6945 RepID=B7PC22_IXOSC|nr:hypothetical protein IscW_ISCW002696 [Ixodes scapularis]|eukprot:XP_002409228.1 hypothetical protein IscW_ISCW002696 [Ixodes scapularis]
MCSPCNVPHDRFFLLFFFYCRGFVYTFVIGDDHALPEFSTRSEEVLNKYIELFFFVGVFNLL